MPGPIYTRIVSVPLDDTDDRGAYHKCPGPRTKVKPALNLT